MIDGLAGGAYRVGGLSEDGGNAEVALCPLRKFGARTRRFVGDLLELSDSLLSASKPFAQLGLSQLGATSATVGKNSFVDEALGIVLRWVDLLHCSNRTGRAG